MAVSDLEQSLSRAQADLAAASAAGKADAIQALSQELAKRQRELDSKILLWEEATKKLAELEKSFSC